MYIDEITKYSNDLTPEEKIIGFLFYVTSSRENVLSRLEDYMFYNPVCKEIFQECKEIVDQLEKFTIDILTEHLDKVKVIAENLLEYETITYQVIKQLLPDSLENSVTINI